MTFIHGLHFNNLRGDMFGGLSAAIITLPIALAFGVAAGAGPEAGLYSAIFVGLFAALFGGTAAQISGPTAPMTVLMTAIFTQYTATDPVHGAAIAFTVVFLAGLFQVLFGLMRLGNYISMIPHPVISGLMSGIGLLIILMQLGPLLGHINPSTPWDAAMRLPKAIANPVNDAMILGLVALMIIYLQPRNLCRYLPAPMTALLIGTLMMLLLFPESMIKTVAYLPAELPRPQWPVFDMPLIIDMIKSALALAVLGSIDTLFASLVTDNITRGHHDANRELIGQGIGNGVAGLFGGLPGSGSALRTVANVRVGGETPLSGVVHSIILLLILLFAGGLASLIPHAVLAAILIKIGTDIIDWDYLKRAHKAPLPGVVVMFTVLLMTVFIDLMIAIGVGITMVSLLYMKRMSDLQLEQTRTITEPSEEHPLSTEEATYIQQAAGRILLFHVSGPMSFGAAKAMVKRVTSVDNYEALVLDLTDVTLVDFTSSLAIEDIILDAQEAGRHIFLAGARPDVKNMLKNQGILKLMLEGHCYETRVEALKNAAELLQ